MAKKKINAVEYRMLIQPTYDETLKKAGTLFVIETVKQFSSFQYEVVVRESVVDKTVLWSLHGLRAPELLMPSFGGARFEKVYFDFNGAYLFTLKKIGGETNEFRLKILPSSVTLLDVPSNPFVSLYGSEKQFEETRDKELRKPKHKPDVRRTLDHLVGKKEA